MPKDKRRPIDQVIAEIESWSREELRNAEAASFDGLGPWSGGTGASSDGADGPRRFRLSPERYVSEDEVIDLTGRIALFFSGREFQDAESEVLPAIEENDLEVFGSDFIDACVAMVSHIVAGPHRGVSLYSRSALSMRMNELQETYGAELIDVIRIRAAQEDPLRSLIGDAARQALLASDIRDQLGEILESLIVSTRALHSLLNPKRN